MFVMMLIEMWLVMKNNDDDYCNSNDVDVDVVDDHTDEDEYVVPR